MKFLTLINHQSIHLNENVKRVPKEEFSKLLSAAELLETIKEEGEAYKKEQEELAEKLKEKAKQKGFEEGLKQWSEQIKLLEEAAQSANKDVEKFLVQIAMATAKKIVGREIKQNPSTISDIVLKNLKAVSAHHKITIYVNKNDYDQIEEDREKLKAICEKASSFSIQIKDDIEPHGAVIETERGIVDARAKNLWKQLEKALEELIRQKLGDQ